MEGLKRTQMYASLTRPRLLAGCEPEPFMMIWGFALLLPYMTAHYMLLVATLPLAALAAYGLSELNKTDPQWFEMYLRSIKLDDYYQARACINAPVESNWSKQFG